MKQITIKGDNLDIQVNGSVIYSDNTVISNRDTDSFYSNGLSKKLILRNGIQVHKFKPLDDLKKELAETDKFGLRVANELPDYVLVAHPSCKYTNETKYQMFRNQQSQWGMGSNLFKTYLFGDYYVNRRTGKTTKEPKGHNPFDDWELLSRSPVSVIKNVGTLSSGNYTQTYMPPWYTNSPKDPDSALQRLNLGLDRIMGRVTRDTLARAEDLRTLNGKPNPISGES